MGTSLLQALGQSHDEVRRTHALRAGRLRHLVENRLLVPNDGRRPFAGTDIVPSLRSPVVVGKSRRSAPSAEKDVVGRGLWVLGHAAPLRKGPANLLVSYQRWYLSAVCLQCVRMLQHGSNLCVGLLWASPRPSRQSLCAEGVQSAEVILTTALFGPSLTAPLCCAGGLAPSGGAPKRVAVRGLGPEARAEPPPGQNINIDFGDHPSGPGDGG